LPGWGSRLGGPSPGTSYLLVRSTTTLISVIRIIAAPSRPCRVLLGFAGATASPLNAYQFTCVAHRIGANLSAVAASDFGGGCGTRRAGGHQVCRRPPPLVRPPGDTRHDNPSLPPFTTVLYAYPRFRQGEKARK